MALPLSLNNHSESSLEERQFIASGCRDLHKQVTETYKWLQDRSRRWPVGISRDANLIQIRQLTMLIVGILGRRAAQIRHRRQ